ncbi:PhzF family phenazine biosynthesis protein [Luteimonas sp. RIT-PG2_3]
MEHPDLRNQHAPDALRYAAFAAAPGGGNPAGIVLRAQGLDVAAMQALAADIGYAETAFVIDRDIAGDPRHHRLRYFSPDAEVPFCGHATIATAVAMAERGGTGPFLFETLVGAVAIETTRSPAGDIIAAFTSVEPRVAPFPSAVFDALMSLLGLCDADLDASYPPMLAFAGNWHPLLVLRSRATFDGFRFDPQAVRALMDANGWAGTVMVAFALSSRGFEVRNLFPVGDIIEDPATGSAAAALGGYLRVTAVLDAPTHIEVHQGAHVGRPSLLAVEIPVAGGIIVSGSASPIA